MDSKSFLSEKLENHSYEELTKLAFNILKTINSIPEGNFEEFKENPNEETIYTEGADGFHKAKMMIEKHYNNYVTSLTQYRILNLLKEKYSNKSYAAKLNLILSLFDDLLEEHTKPVVATQTFIINDIVDYNTQFLDDLNQKIFFNDKLVLAKKLLISEHKTAEENEEYLSDLKNDLNEHNFNYSDDISKNCVVCDNNPCTCSDPQHNW